MKNSRFISPALCGIALVICCPATSGAASLPMKEPRLTEEQGKAQLEEFARMWHTRGAREARAKNIRESILREAHLSPLPVRNDLKPIVWGKQECRGYTVENVAFESLPGFFVTGNLYRPTEGKGPFAGVLCPHGHGPKARFNAATQARSAVLARMGAVVFAYDMLGIGESRQTTHADDNVLTLQLWDSMRALDFLTSFPDVDPKRIGCTGESGGGTQTFLLGAVDDRVKVSVPVVMVSAHFFGGCKCESGLPLHHGPDHDTDNVEFAGLFAPKPQLLISDGKDWTKNVPDVELPYLRSVYKLYRAEKNLENVHLMDEGHDYGPSKREAMYRFMAKHLKLDFEKATRADGRIDEADTFLDESVITVFTPEN